MTNSLVLKVECYTGNEYNPSDTSFFTLGKTIRVSEGFFCKTVDELQHTFRAVVDFPTTKTLEKVFYTNKQSVYKKLYLDSRGDIVSLYVFTNLTEGE